MVSLSNLILELRLICGSPEEQKQSLTDWAGRSSTVKPRKQPHHRRLNWYVPLSIERLRKLIFQYTLDDGNPLASVTHERDLDEFLANAALADADFTTGKSDLDCVRAMLMR
jgi:hypothetical protein